jgi:1-acyl-sn-glycerol-3-phosphate acyltransferase
MAASMGVPLRSIKMSFKPRGMWPHAWFMTKVLRRVLRGLAHSKIFPAEVINREAVPQTGGCIIAANHESTLDFPYIWGAMRRVVVAMAMAEIWHWPIVGQLAWLMDMVAVKRGNRESGSKAIKRAIRWISHGGAFLIFPGGGLNRPFKPGVYILARETNAPVIPCGIFGSARIKPPGKWMIYPGRLVRVAFGEPMYARNFEGPNAQDEFLAELQRRIIELTA